MINDDNEILDFIVRYWENILIALLMISLLTIWATGTYIHVLKPY